MQSHPDAEPASLQLPGTQFLLFSIPRHQLFPSALDSPRRQEGLQYLAEAPPHVRPLG